ncbi:RNA helicase [Kwoniella heveanensis BCC8398]|uniref:RNA helicase n=1 Tax=Kwoniella heveanensis BCC8398 TaxID=1296120 RepID=A0A1B9GT85_9TREE|nr:RNA helicase [Kwoniella heveanensis BCC8398]
MSAQHHIDSLFEPPASSASDGDWEALISSFALGDTIASSSLGDEPPEPVFATTPWPSVLDHLAGPSAVDAITSTPGTAPLAAVSQAASESRNRAQEQPRRVSAPSDLIERIKGHLPVTSTFNSLLTLLGSARPNDDIQSELIEIMGFEGEGLTLVEEILKPGIRGWIVDECGHGSHPPQTQSSSGYVPSGSRVTVKGKGKDKKTINISDVIGSAEDIERRIQEQLERPKAMFSEGGPRIVEQEVLPNVYTSSGSKAVNTSYGGQIALPMGTQRVITDICEEVTVPPTNPVPPKRSERIVKIAQLPKLARNCFPKYVELNRMQSIVQPTAMETNENMLVCAPTGAGKTDVAIMSIIRVLSQYVRAESNAFPSSFDLNKDAFKIIYVAPMKALAAEITAKFGKRLAWLGVKVRELTGDMQLTRQEINDTQIIVTTPEKWDVVTRKPTGEGELAAKVRLLIIDEVHLLNEERGAVIETIVARTLRQVESSQSLIRIVGLSATLPNYIDVSDFLRVNRYQGLFFFDASFRPVPLEQHFIGIAGKPRSAVSARNMDRVVFDKVSELVQAGHQVMVFVHARKETVKTAQKLKEMAIEDGVSTFFETTDHPKYGLYKRDIGTSRNKEMKELFEAGFGIHHAGMLRSDRTMMERMFEDNCINVLCCTSTLAWGVNLPAHAVIIKGTQVYDSGKGAFMDLSVLDVLQIFGRAGRPGYETSGVGYICTTQDKLDHYLHTIMAQHPIESKFIPGMVDSLNAEIALGTIANVSEAIQWLGYTYLFVRMRKEPFIYGMPHDVVRDDPQLGNKRNELIIQAARLLQAAKMIRYDEISNSFIMSDLGRIAAKYYLRYQTIEVFNTRFNPRMSNADLFQMLCEATEFDQIQLRDNEVEELEAINKSDVIPLEVAGGATDRRGKVNILLQAHVSRVYIEDFALVSDAAYVAQNAARIIRALLEIALSRNWANCSYLLVELSKCIEQRQWVYDHGLAQLNILHRDTLHKLNQYTPDDMTIADFRNMSAAELGEFIHMNEKHGQAVLDAATMFPTVAMSYRLRPISHDLLQMNIKVEPQFKWNNRISGSSQPFYVWAQDEEGLNIYQWRSVRIQPTTSVIDLEFILPFEENLPSAISIVSISDRWLWSHEQINITLSDLSMPDHPPPHTELLDIPFLRLSCLDDPGLEAAYRETGGMSTLNGIQSQAFWTLYNTSVNALVSAPVASGKSFLGEAAIWNAFRHNSDAVVLIVVPQHQAVLETVARLRSICPRGKNIDILPLFSSSEFGRLASPRGSIGVTTPYHLMDNGRIDETLSLRQLGLVVLEDLHLLDEIYELCVAKILSFAKSVRTRIVGLTSSLDDPSTLASWIGLDRVTLPSDGELTADEEPMQPPALYSFAPANRGNPISVSIKPFAIPHGPTLLRSMTKPTYDILKSVVGGAIIFVPSRGACVSVATDLVKQSGTEMDLNGFLSTPRDHVEPLLQRLRDRSLYEPILHGIGYIHPNASPSDLALVLELFASGILRALIVPRTSCWTLPVKGDTVIVMGAQYAQTTAIPGRQMKGGKEAFERTIINYSRKELVKMQGYAIRSASPSGEGGRMFVMCQAEQQVLISRVLSDGLPLESTLPDLLQRHPRQGRDARAEKTLKAIFKNRKAPPPQQANRPKVVDLRKRDMMDLLNWTYFVQRATKNPSYYDLLKGEEESLISRWIDTFFDGIDEEESAKNGNKEVETATNAKGQGKGKNIVKNGDKVNGDDEHVDGGENDEMDVDADDEVNGKPIAVVGDEVNGDAAVGEKDGETFEKHGPAE